MARLSVDGVELPVRPGFQVEPGDGAAGLKRAKEALGRFGIEVLSVAGGMDAETVRAVGEAGLPLIRVCLGIDMEKGYHASVEEYRRKIEELVPLLEQNQVVLGIQNHNGAMIGSALGVWELIQSFPRQQVAGVLDFAHCFFAGEPSKMALDILRDRLALVNFKSGIWRLTKKPENNKGEAQWSPFWTECRRSGYSWSAAAKALAAIDWRGPICLPAEYSNQAGTAPPPLPQVTQMLEKDIAHIRRVYPGQAQ